MTLNFELELGQWCMSSTHSDAEVALVMHAKVHHEQLQRCYVHCFGMQANPTGDPDHPGLSIAWGACGHVFHLDCIQRWLKTRSACPLCNKEWDFLKIERILAGESPTRPG